VLDFGTDHLVTVQEEIDHFGVRFDPSALIFGAHRVRDDEAERIDRPVWDADRTLDVRREVRLHFPRFFGAEFLCGDATFVAPVEFLLKVFVRVFRTLNEEAAGHLDAVASDVPEDAIFLDTFGRALLI
jgi:hypothetical protein